MKKKSNLILCYFSTACWLVNGLASWIRSPPVQTLSLISCTL